MSQQEEWRDVSGFEGYYQVSNYGRVKSLDRIDSAGRQLKGVIRRHSVARYKNGLVPLWKDGKQKNHSVQRLVAMAFIPNPNSLRFVRRINSTNINNVASNLKWTNRQYGGKQ